MKFKKSQKNNSLFADLEDYYLFFDESGTAELNDKSDNIFILCCIKVQKEYYDNYFRKTVSKFKKKYNLTEIVLHSSDIRKHRKNFKFLSGDSAKNIRDCFYKDLSGMIAGLDFDVYYFTFDKNDINDIKYYIDIYWHSLKQVLLMVKNDLKISNEVVNVFCESRNKDQNNKLQNAYSSYIQTIINDNKLKICLPSSIIFSLKVSTLYEINGLEMADLIAFPIFNYIRAKVNKTSISEYWNDYYFSIRPKVIKNYHFRLREKYKKPPSNVDKC